MHILISDDLCEFYDISDSPPPDQSKVPHVALLATPVYKFVAKHQIVRKVYDMRASNLSAFVTQLQHVNWSFMYDSMISLDCKAQMFHDTLNQVVDVTIPSSYVTMTTKDKPWITPVIKQMINKRWEAYRSRRFQVYEHLKHKVRNEITKSKLN